MDSTETESVRSFMQSRQLSIATVEVGVERDKWKWKKA
jgi:hypothetical protein